MISLKLLLESALPSTKVFMYSREEEKLKDIGSAITVISVIESSGEDYDVEYFTCRDGQINVYLDI